MWEKINRYVKKNHMIEPGDRVLLGISGGADSVALARYLLILREKGIIDLYAIHVNHQLRGEEAQRDADFVLAFCDHWHIPCEIVTEDVTGYAKKRKRSLEEAGREIRYAKMEEYAEKYHCSKIALAHHADDLAETMIFRMLRGTGPEGLVGILPIYKNRIRPLLCVDKKEILEYLLENEQAYVEDSSNQEIDYSRNYIRSLILPKMREVNTQAVSHMGDLSEKLEAQNSFVKKQLDKIYEEQVIRQEKGLGIAISFFEKEDSFVRSELIRRMLFDFCGKRRDLAAVHVDIVENLLEKDSGKYNLLPYQMIAYRGEEVLWIGHKDLLLKEDGQQAESFYVEIPREQLEKNENYEVIIGKDEKMIFYLSDDLEGEIPKNDCIKCFDYDKIKCTLSIRTRKKGDYLVLDDSGKRKMIRRYFIDEKIPCHQRDQILLLAEENHVLCVNGKRISEAYKVTKSTKRILKVRYLKNEL
ncbi:MAG: tRNA lysidine(34) synthetase TilS [Eubacteriales bacterium]|nr:tRNA lysidine(34) synthetase TilS [Eubacteriales bacterium]